MSKFIVILIFYILSLKTFAYSEVECKKFLHRGYLDKPASNSSVSAMHSLLNAILNENSQRALDLIDEKTPINFFVRKSELGTVGPFDVAIAKENYVVLRKLIAHKCYHAKYILQKFNLAPTKKMIDFLINEANLNINSSSKPKGFIKRPSYYLGNHELQRHLFETRVNQIDFTLGRKLKNIDFLTHLHISENYSLLEDILKSPMGRQLIKKDSSVLYGAISVASETNDLKIVKLLLEMPETNVMMETPGEGPYWDRTWRLPISSIPRYSKVDSYDMEIFKLYFRHPKFDVTWRGGRIFKIIANYDFQSLDITRELLSARPAVIAQLRNKDLFGLLLPQYISGPRWGRGDYDNPDHSGSLKIAKYLIENHELSPNELDQFGFNVMDKLLRVTRFSHYARKAKIFIEQVGGKPSRPGGALLVPSKELVEKFRKANSENINQLIDSETPNFLSSRLSSLRENRLIPPLLYFMYVNQELALKMIAHPKVNINMPGNLVPHKDFDLEPPLFLAIWKYKKYPELLTALLSRTDLKLDIMIRGITATDLAKELKNGSYEKLVEFGIH